MTPEILLTGDRMSTVPLIPSAEDASTTLLGSARKTFETIEIFPPVPAKA